MKQAKAIILLSGGIDSQTCLAIARHQDYQCYALAVDYGQKHQVELQSAARIAESLEAKEFRIITVNLGEMPGAALTDSHTAVPNYECSNRIKTTYFPARNTIFLSFALAWAESVRAEKVFFGANLSDYYGFPDTRPEYLEAFTKMALLATKTGVLNELNFTIEAPLLKLDKKEIIQLGLELGVDYSLSTTCYQANLEGLACGVCDSCTIRKNAFAELGVSDPARYFSSNKSCQN